MYKILIPLSLVFIALFLFQDKKEEVTPKRKVAATIVKDLKPFDQEAVDISRLPATVKHPKRGKKIGLVAPKNEPVKRRSHPWPEDSIRELERGLQLIKNLYAVASEDFDPRSGDYIQIENGMTYFVSPHRPINAANVAYDPNKDKYYPISAVLKIENVDEVLRQELIGSGLEEHYYQSALKVMFIQSNHEQVVTLYEDLLEKKIKAKLEVIKGFNRPR